MGLQVPFAPYLFVFFFFITVTIYLERLRPRGQATLGLFGWGCAAGTMEPLAYTRASSSKFCYPILD